ncbi:hypothetical protein ACFXTH_041563 [Malus domestica]
MLHHPHPNHLLFPHKHQHHYSFGFDFIVAASAPPLRAFATALISLQHRYSGNKEPGKREVWMYGLAGSP